MTIERRLKLARKRAESDIQLEDESLRVTHWRLAPGTETGWHVHGYPYVVVPVRGGVLTVEDTEGSRDYEIVTASSYSRPKGVKHNIANDTGNEISFVEVELLR